MGVEISGFDWVVGTEGPVVRYKEGPAVCYIEAPRWKWRVKKCLPWTKTLNVYTVIERKDV